MRQDNHRARVIAIRVALFSVACAFFFFAGAANTYASLGSPQGGADFGNGSVTGSSATLNNSGLQNPLNKNFSNIGSFVEGAVKVLISIAVPILALMIMYSGFMFVAARGNAKKLAVARQNFIYVIIGTIMILGFSAFILLLENTVSQLLG